MIAWWKCFMVVIMMGTSFCDLNSNYKCYDGLVKVFYGSNNEANVVRECASIINWTGYKPSLVCTENVMAAFENATINKLKELS